MIDDAELLRRYVKSLSETDFRTLVERHLDPVYYAALRRTGGRHDLAEEISQQVFTTLVREAPQLESHPTIVGWLFTVTRYAANQHMRAERRRRERETDAFMNGTLEDSGTAAGLDKIRGELDSVMDELPERDRIVILLRFFRQHPFAEVGRALGLSEDSARKRVTRALDKLRDRFARRGITSSAAVLATLLTQETAAAAPAGLAQSVATGALLPCATGALPVAELALFMKTKTVLTLAGTLGLAGFLTLPPVGLALYQSRQAVSLEATVAAANRDAYLRSARLRALQDEGRAAAQAVSDLQAELKRARSAQTTSTSGTSGRAAPPALANPQAEALRNGREFLAQTPEARRPLLEFSRAQIRANLAGFYKAVGLAPDKVEKLEARTAQVWLENLAITPENFAPTQQALPADQMREILGEEGYIKYVEYERGRAAYRVVRDTATMVAAATTPLSVAQTEALERTIRENSPAYQGGRTLTVRNVDWAAAAERSRALLTPEQWREASRTFLGEQLDSAIDLHWQSAAAPGRKAP